MLYCTPILAPQPPPPALLHDIQAPSRTPTSRPEPWYVDPPPWNNPPATHVGADTTSQSSTSSAPAKGGITSWVLPSDTSGEFKRQVSSFRSWISRDAGAEFPPEKGRYHIYASYACPWAHRTLITRRLKGLEDVISFSVVHWHLGEKGWRFVEKGEDVPGDNVVPDPVDGHGAFTHLRDLYFESEKDYQGRFTVPVLYDKKAKRIVSNESSEILRMLGTEVSLSQPTHAWPGSKKRRGRENG